MYNLLVIDDDPVMGELMRAICVRFEVEITHVTNGHDGLKHLESNIPHVIFTDIRLPGTVDGWEVARQIREKPHLSHIPVVVISAENCSLIQIHAAQCQGYFRKPFSISHMREFIIEMLQERL